MELQITFKLVDRKSADEKIMNFVTLVILFDGIEDLSNQSCSHPFLDQFDLDCLPQNEGEIKMLQKIIDFDLLFDSNVQPYVKKNNPGKCIS